MSLFKYGIFVGSSVAMVSQDHLFESEQVRDAYFTDNLDELLTGTPIVVNRSGRTVFQVWGGASGPDTYDNSQWADSTSVTGQQIIMLVNAEADANIMTDNQRNASNSVAQLTEGRLPVATATGLQDTKHRILPEGNLFVAGDLETESGTITLGDLIRLSESGGLVSYLNGISSVRRNLVDYLAPTDGNSGKARRFNLTQAERRLIVNGEVGTSIQGRSGKLTVTTPSSGRVNSLIISSFLGINNLRIRITSMSPVAEAVVKYLPSRASWLTESGGYDFPSRGGPPSPDEHVISLSDSPLIFDSGRQLAIDFSNSSGDLAGGSNGPFLAVMVQNGVFVNLADIGDIPESQAGSGIGIDRANPLRPVISNTRVNTDTLGVNIQDSGTVEGSDVRTINFDANLAVSVSGGVATITAPAVAAAASIQWDHAALPSGRIPANTRRWYTYTGAANATRDLPLKSGITSGWHAFFGNDSRSGTLMLQGDFRGSVARISLLPQQGCEVGYNGSIFLEGPSRDSITVSGFQDWSGNPLRHDSSYTGFSTDSSGLNLGDSDARAALLNRTVRISTRMDRDFLFDLESLDSSDFPDVPLRSGFAVVASGPRDVIIRPRGDDTITRGVITYTFRNPLRLSPGASVTFIRSGADAWNVTAQDGTITGGS